MRMVSRALQTEMQLMRANYKLGLARIELEGAGLKERAPVSPRTRLVAARRLGRRELKLHDRYAAELLPLIERSERLRSASLQSVEERAVALYWETTRTGLACLSLCKSRRRMRGPLAEAAATHAIRGTADTEHVQALRRGAPGVAGGSALGAEGARRRAVLAGLAGRQVQKFSTHYRGLIATEMREAVVPEGYEGVLSVRRRELNRIRLSGYALCLRLLRGDLSL